MAEYVYLMAGEDAIKVGVSNDPERRLGEVSDRLGPGARVVETYRCTTRERAFRVESGLHKLLDAYRIDALGRECYKVVALGMVQDFLRALDAQIEREQELRSENRFLEPLQRWVLQTLHGARHPLDSTDFIVAANTGCNFRGPGVKSGEKWFRHALVGVLQDLEFHGVVSIEGKLQAGGGWRAMPCADWWESYPDDVDTGIACFGLHHSFVPGVVVLNAGWWVSEDLYCFSIHTDARDAPASAIATRAQIDSLQELLSTTGTYMVGTPTYTRCARLVVRRTVDGPTLSWLPSPLSPPLEPPKPRRPPHLLAEPSPSDDLDTYSLKWWLQRSGRVETASCGGEWTPASDLYDAFHEWCRFEHCEPPTADKMINFLDEVCEKSQDGRYKLGVVRGLQHFDGQTIECRGGADPCMVRCARVTGLVVEVTREDGEVFEVRCDGSGGLDNMLWALSRNRPVRFLVDATGRAVWNGRLAGVYVCRH